MGKTRSGKLRSSSDAVIRCLKGCLIQRAWLLLKGKVSLKESSKEVGFMEKCDGKGHCHPLPYAEEDGSEPPNPMEETTVMSQGLINMWLLLGKQKVSCTKITGMVVTGVSLRSGFETGTR